MNDLRAFGSIVISPELAVRIGHDESQGVAGRGLNSLTFEDLAESAAFGFKVGAFVGSAYMVLRFLAWCLG